MRVAYLDCFSGISGDLLLGALLDAGVDLQPLRDTVAALNIGADLRVTRVNRCGISATKVDVLVDGELAESQGHHHTPDRNHHDHESQHDDNRSSHSGHHHRHHPPRAHSPAHAHHRSLSTILGILANVDIPERARAIAVRAFQLLGEAEARIHGVPVEKIHFHEVGAVDTIVDIVCAAVGCNSLAARFVCSPLNVGSGTVKCAHGMFPVPGPATLAILAGAPIYSSGLKAELVTPTGAAMVRALHCGFSELPRMRVDAIGYGAGNHNFAEIPNVLRLCVGEVRDTRTQHSVWKGDFISSSESAHGLR